MSHPNRSRRKDAPGRNPTPDEIREARERANLSQTAAAALCYSTLRSWQNWEAGATRMHPAIWLYWRSRLLS
jgi:DNA-binding transcriptional regulator YiaG